VFPRKTLKFLPLAYYHWFCTIVSRSYMDMSVTEILKLRLKKFTAFFITVYHLCYPQIFKYLPQHMKVFKIFKCCILIYSNGSFKTLLELFYFWEIQKSYHLIYISFKIFPFRNYTHLRASIKLLETFLEAILWKSFQLFLHILNP